MMIKMFTAFLLFSFTFITLNAQKTTEIVTISGGGLEEALAGKDLWNIGSLKINGGISKSDFNYIKTSLSGLETLNFRDAEIEAEGEYLANVVPDEALQYNYSLKEIYVSTTATKVGKYAFSGISALEVLSLPLSITEIDDYAISSSGMEQILLTNVEVIGNNAFADCANLSSVYITERTNEIGDGAFKQCRSLVSVAFFGNMSATHMGTGVFEDCVVLDNFVYPDGLSYIPDNTFLGCAKLAEVVIPEGVETIGASAFKNCNDLPEIRIPASVTHIGADAFKGNYNLINVYSYNMVPPTIDSEKAFETDLKTNTGTLHVTGGALSAYEVAFEWEEFLIKKEELITSIDKETVAGTENLLLVKGNELIINSDDSLFEISVFNLEGKQVLLKKVNGGGSVNISALTNGVYVVKVDGKNLSIQEKIIKK